MTKCIVFSHSALGQKKDIGEKTGEIQIESGIEWTATCQSWLLRCDKCTTMMLSLGESQGGLHSSSLYYLCNFSVHLKMFQSKRFIFKIIDYLVITYNGKESKKEKIYIYTYLNHFALHLKLIQYYKSTILQLKTSKKLLMTPKNFYLGELYQ